MTAFAVDIAVAELSGRQCGVFSRAQVLAVGGSDDLIRRRRSSRRWLDRAEGVYSVPGIPESWEQRMWIASLASSAGPVVSHEAAAALHGLPTFEPGPVVVTVRHSDSRLAHLATVHQSRNLPPEDVTEVAGLPVTTITRTIIDLAMVCRRSRVEYLLDQTVSDGEVTYEEVAARLDIVARRGRKGSGLLRKLLAARLGGYAPPASRLEAKLLAVLRGAGLPPPVPQFPLPGRTRPEGTVDAAYPEARLLIEADGRRYHTRVRDFAVDRERDNLANLAGWIPLRFTWHDLTKRPEWVVECVRRGLRLRTPQPASGEPDPS